MTHVCDITHELVDNEFIICTVELFFNLSVTNITNIINNFQRESCNTHYLREDTSLRCVFLMTKGSE